MQSCCGNNLFVGATQVLWTDVYIVYSYILLSYLGI